MPFRPAFIPGSFKSGRRLKKTSVDEFRRGWRSDGDLRGQQLEPQHQISVSLIEEQTVVSTETSRPPSLQSEQDRLLSFISNHEHERPLHRSRAAACLIFCQPSLLDLKVKNTNY